MTTKTIFVSLDGIEHNTRSEAEHYAKDQASLLFEKALMRVEVIPTRAARANHMARDGDTKQLLYEAGRWLADSDELSTEDP